MGLKSAMQKRYDLLRDRASQEAQSQGQQAQDVLQRRMAQLGNLQSGAAIKQQQILGEQVAQQKQKAMEGIDIAQSQEEAQQEAQEKQRQFARSEREAAQGFSSGEAEKQRGFQKGMFEQEFGLKQKQLDMASQEMKQNAEITAFNAFAQALASGDAASYQPALDALYNQLGVSNPQNLSTKPVTAKAQANLEAIKPVTSGWRKWFH